MTRSPTKDLTVDETRWPAYRCLIETGIYVRAKTPTGWESVDIAMLDKNSLLRWLRSEAGENVLAENVIGMVLGHGHLH